MSSVIDDYRASIRPWLDAIGPIGPSGMSAKQNDTFRDLAEVHPDFPMAALFASIIEDGGQRFYCQLQIVPEMFRFGYDMLMHGMLPIPATEGVYEFAGQGRDGTLAMAVAARVRNEKMEIVTVGRLQEIDAIMPSSLVTIALKDARGDGGIRIHEPRCDKADEEAGQSLAMNGTWLLIGLFAAMTLKDVSRSVETPNARVNRKRIARGEAPLPTRNLLTLRAPGTMAARHGGDAGTHASPRYHFRRGHLRTLLRDTAKIVVNVRPTWVGDPSLGEIVKAYRITEAETHSS